MRMLWVVVAAALGMLLAGSIYVVGEQQVGLQFQFGRIVRTDIKPGLHFKLPLAQTVMRFDHQVLMLEATPIRLYTQDKNNVSVDYFALWQIADVATFYKATLGTTANAEQRLTPILLNALKNTINQRQLGDILALDRGNLGGNMLAEVNKVTRPSLGIEVLDIRVKRIDLPEDNNVLSTVYDRMRAERSRVASALRAQGDEEASKIHAEADRDRLVILAEAERDAQQLRGEGDAEAAAIGAQAYAQDPEFYGFYRSLQAYRNAFGSRDVIVLDPDSDLLRYFMGPGRASGQTQP